MRVDSDQVEFGTVCGMNLAAADVVCRQMGYASGTVSSSSCSDYGGAHMCGVAGTPVAMQSVECTGGELSITSCSFSAPSEICASHQQDSIVYCANPGAGLPQEGALRLLEGGAPTISGTGTLGIFRAGSWSPVCSDGFSAGAATVACKSMGYSGARSSIADCAATGCGDSPPEISEVSCSGAEATLLSCPFAEGEDVFCAPAEAVAISCVGDGDGQGRPM